MYLQIDLCRSHLSLDFFLAKSPLRSTNSVSTSPITLRRCDKWATQWAGHYFISAVICTSFIQSCFSNWLRTLFGSSQLIYACMLNTCQEAVAACSEPHGARGPMSGGRRCAVTAATARSCRRGRGPAER